jgi:muconolactone delta-isomerase
VFGEKDRSRRLQNESKAITRKLRNGGKLTGRERARLTKVTGSLIKYSVEDVEDFNAYEYNKE